MKQKAFVKKNDIMKDLLGAGIIVMCMACSHICAGQSTDNAGELKKVEDFYNAGKKYMQAGNFSAANEEFMKAELVLRLRREMPTELLTFDSVAAPNAAIEANVVPEHALEPNVYYNLGVGALQKGDFAQAESAFLRVLQINPLDKEACYNLGVLYEKFLDRPEEAVRYYTRYINLTDDADRDVEQVKSWIKEMKQRARQ
jgi:tetratricopeptide (TPR) repeat protein